MPIDQDNGPVHVLDPWDWQKARPLLLTELQTHRDPDTGQLTFRGKIAVADLKSRRQEAVKQIVPRPMRCNLFINSVNLHSEDGCIYPLWIMGNKWTSGATGSYVLRPKPGATELPLTKIYQNDRKDGLVVLRGQIWNTKLTGILKQLKETAGGKLTHVGIEVRLTPFKKPTKDHGILWTLFLAVPRTVK